MGASQSVEERTPVDVEAPEIEPEVETNYNQHYEEMETVDSLFLTWWF